ncbi:MAG: hypothetical protein HOW73_24115 [Polyangiaceae bacterium]|nr:hypothetical protein [Polyangiaceae bacterium]
MSMHGTVTIRAILMNDRRRTINEHVLDDYLRATGMQRKNLVCKRVVRGWPNRDTGPSKDRTRLPARATSEQCEVVAYERSQVELPIEG